MSITSLRALMGGRDEVMRADVLDLAILVRNESARILKEQIAPMAVIPRFANWSNRRVDRLFNCGGDCNVGCVSSSRVIRCASAGRRVRRSCSRSVRGASTFVGYIAPAPAVSRVAPCAVANRDGVPSTAVQGGRMEIAVQVLAPSPTTAVELTQDPAGYVQGQARLPTTVMTIVLAPVVVSPTGAAQMSQVTTAATVYQGGCSRSHDDRDHHGAYNASDDSGGISCSHRGVHRACPAVSHAAPA